MGHTYGKGTNETEVVRERRWKKYLTLLVDNELVVEFTELGTLFTWFSVLSSQHIVALHEMKVDM